MPRGLQLPNSTAGPLFSTWQTKIREHDARYQHFEFIHELPLSEPQLALFAKYVHLRDQAKNRFGLKRLSRFKDEPFFLVADAQGLRPWQSADTQQLFTHISQWIKRLHPGWVSVQPSRLAKTFRAYYTAQFGFDPIYAAYISGIIPAELEQPIHYALVDSRQLRNRYWAAQNKFRRLLADEYAHVWKKYTHVELPGIVWQGIKPKLVRDASLGSWRCPYREHLIWIIEQLTRMTYSPDETLAHNARVTLLAVMLQLTLGLRPFEVTRLTRQTVDLYAGTILVVGKSNYAYESYRLLPFPRELTTLIRYALSENEKFAQRNANTPLLHIYHDGAYRSARLMDIQLVWEQAAIASGKLRSEQIPELGSLRHFYRTFALKTGFPYQVVNALMGASVGWLRTLPSLLESRHAPGLGSWDSLGKQDCYERSF